MLRSKNGPATMPDLEVPIDQYPDVITAREGLQAAIEQQERLSAEWATVQETLRTDIPTSSSRRLSSAEEKRLALKRRTSLLDEFEQAEEAVALARARLAQARADAKQMFLDIHLPRLRELFHEACAPLDEVAERVDASGSGIGSCATSGN